MRSTFRKEFKLAEILLWPMFLLSIAEATLSVFKFIELLKWFLIYG